MTGIQSEEALSRTERVDAVCKKVYETAEAVGQIDEPFAKHLILCAARLLRENQMRENADISAASPSR